MYLIYRTELFRVGGLVLGGQAIVTNRHSSLSDRERGRVIKREGESNRQKERDQ
jgi:hypothetical protein